jgi:hypothetical protein
VFDLDKLSQPCLMFASKAWPTQVKHLSSGPHPRVGFWPFPQTLDKTGTNSRPHFKQKKFYDTAALGHTLYGWILLMFVIS